MADPELPLDLPPGLPDAATRWLTLTLTRETLPGLAAARRWPVRADHCFQRILLDAACGGRWYDHILARPAYRHAPPEILARAIALGDAVIAGTEDLHALNRRSLAWRGKTRSLAD
ncbi:GCN5-related N-acetyltransferase [Sphingomonas ginsenosidivorax]|uniref:GCN5-related N-acetyltransferase n=1 Tax=Sphingomonas ginsenosidivorax TaxID=862135 RepID=UPI001F54D0F8|nr:GCN5-related N-acetyltransferase [Sphingomonas ginsenosidivorax]